MIYILVRVDPDKDVRLRWWPDDQRVEALQTMNRWNGYGGGTRYRIDTTSNEALVNDYPYSEIPDAMGDSPVAFMDDGGYLCEFCVADPFNPVHDERQSHLGALGHDGWGVIEWFDSAEEFERTQCDHCGRILNEGGDD